eukprot:TRINITY_DN10140_c0_g1_i1.p1 TRINITY_DN10140_c0_g1~~TRINITY_DN10140_c0_g1_i1.p1  ORF type:complete len:64 (-),score=0.79 TRINITY_DN10140_c0_g1_i1:691-882(-)
MDLNTVRWQNKCYRGASNNIFINLTVTIIVFFVAYFRGPRINRRVHVITIIKTSKTIAIVINL